ncbi:hypothetical protein CONPUDRAFT_154728 [Coniophora puteana RWD-64-598 SS2]|uniref:Uncharacterized protein n=1 Tax=Coniophora puteana (strain RWD-64-598) TaxID=741705 RepID=A0A5M3MNI8_CONPW|nr:uncharacterized protein CONPUDRAFT_154728 [Coniophora puteana RWD-64-598 SS2]EIW80722.1 hypothetical protein CONPUDRAFT_154728 [Coniophora puteana RWD-64-598 SS2]
MLPSLYDAVKYTLEWMVPLLPQIPIVPFGIAARGVLVRYRAHYTPKRLQLDAEGDVRPYTGPVVASYFGMYRRVYNIESFAAVAPPIQGVSGFLKGPMPFD